MKRQCSKRPPPIKTQRPAPNTTIHLTRHPFITDGGNRTFDCPSPSPFFFLCLYFNSDCIHFPLPLSFCFSLQYNLQVSRPALRHPSLSPPKRQHS